MPRLFRSRTVRDIAVTILAVFAAVSIADIDDYGVHPRALPSSSFHSLESADSSPEKFPAFADAESDPDHSCSCMLCVTTLSSVSAPWMLPPSAEPLSEPGAGGIVLPAHVSEVFHPPSS